MSGATNIGGFVGVLSCWDDADDTFSFTNITTTSKVSGSTNTGVLIGENNAVTVKSTFKILDTTPVCNVFHIDIAGHYKVYSCS